jgi:hypothetical protein
MRIIWCLATFILGMNVLIVRADSIQTYSREFDNAELVNPIKKRLDYQPRPPVIAKIKLVDTFHTKGVTEVQVFAPVFPTLERQQIISETALAIRPMPETGYPQVQSDLSSLHRNILLTQADMTTTTKGFTATLSAHLVLNSIQLVDLGPAEPVPDIKPLPEEIRKNSLRSTTFFNFRNADFQNWLDVNNLHPAYQETRLDFARRMYKYIQNNFTYYYSNDLNRAATNTIKTGKTDCGGFSILYSSILRYHGIPARTLVGRWAEYGDDDEECECHVKSEFYLAHVGWVPVDVTSGVTDHTNPDDMSFFGVDDGNFLTMHVDPELVVSTIYGNKKIDFLQDFNYWVRTPGRFEDEQYEMWSVHRM